MHAARAPPRRARARARTPDGDARQAATAAPHRPRARGAGRVEPGAARRAARRRRRRGDAGDGEPRPRGSRRGEGAHPRRDDGVRHPRARQGAARARRPPPPGDGRVRRRGCPQRQPRGAAHAAGLRPRGRLGARPGRRSPTCSARSPATTRSSSCAPSRPAAARSRAAWPRSPASSRGTRRAASSMPKRVVLAYSGGLDTSVAVRWISEEWGAEVVALAVDVGQAEPDDDWTDPRARARRAARSRSIVVDARDEFAEEFVRPRCRPTRSTRASTRSSRRCRAR